MPPSFEHPLIDFLMADLAVPAESIAMGLRQIGSATNLLPMVLWQYGLVSTEELNRIFEWVERTAPVVPPLPCPSADKLRIYPVIPATEVGLRPQDGAVIATVRSEAQSERYLQKLI